ncbi:MAG: bifunctional UDP-N-acetylglucosamine diphosphorylase/glucosamine-1-phosphate N-acetyltransferase GlmU [Christensenellaceae bacterium]
MKKCMAVILAAGEGTRMKSKMPKVLHEAAGTSMLEWVIRAVKGVDTQKCVVVCGRGEQEIKNKFGETVEYATQSERLGSGHAVLCAKKNLENFDGYTLIVAGDMPLLRGDTIQNMVEASEGYDCIVLSAELENPYGYGRIVRDCNGNVQEIVEEKDATDKQRSIKEVNSSCYCVKNKLLLECLKLIKPANAQGEYYLTDIVSILNSKGHRVGAYIAQDAQECMGVNDRVQLAQVSEILRERILKKHLLNGVTIMDPKNVYIDEDSVIGADTVIYPNVILENGCHIGQDVVLYQGSRLSHAVIGDNTIVQNSVILDAQVGSNTTVGPYAYIRPQSEIGSHCRIGDFVEIKNSVIDDGTKVSHLTYIGDADFGKNINVGCGVVVVNYDGKSKFRTEVGDEAFIGCNTNLISPVSVGAGAYIAAGSTITDEVPKSALAIARARQVIKENWEDKRKR